MQTDRSRPATLNIRVFTQPGSIASVWTFTDDFSSAPVNGHRQIGLAGPVRVPSFNSWSVQ
jgi:hypothetical protein